MVENRVENNGGITKDERAQLQWIAKEEAISEVANAFVNLFEFKSIEWQTKARSWAENLARFSEGPILIKRADPIPGSDEAMRLTLTVFNRDLNLDFSSSGRVVIIWYHDGILQQQAESSDSPWTDIILPWGKDRPGRLLFCLENDDSVGITKEFGTVVVQAFSHKPYTSAR